MIEAYAIGESHEEPKVVGKLTARKFGAKGYLNLADHDGDDLDESDIAAEGGVKDNTPTTRCIAVDLSRCSNDRGNTEDVHHEVASEKLEDGTSGRLAVFATLNFVYVVLQLWGSMAFGSLALLSDGFHNLSDVAAIRMASYIHKLQRMPCPANTERGSDRLPYGYKRAEVIGGLINSVALVSLSAYVRHVLNTPTFLQ